MKATATEWLAAAALLAACLGAAKAATLGADLVGNETQVVDNSLDDDQDNNKSLQELCAAKQLVSCLKLSLYRGLERLSHRPHLELLPGLVVSGDVTSLQELSRDVTSGRLDDQLLRSLTRYLASLSLTAKVMDGGVVQRIKEVGDAFTQGPSEDSTATGRRKRFGSSMMMAGMMSGGSLMALAMSAIAMMAGKALMTALLSLMMSAMMTMNGGGMGGKGGGGGGEKVSYEIIHAHDIKHRSMDPVSAPDAYPYLLPQPAVRRNILIPLHRRR